ncbi:unnamed protein product, partial [Candidula unifasciata]
VPEPGIRITAPPPKSDCALSRADLIIVIDSSTSVTEVNFKKVLLFLQEFLKKADIDSGNVRVGIIQYSTNVYQVFQLNTFSTSQEILKAVAQIPYRFGSTNTAGALDVMRTVMFTSANGDRPDVPNVAVVLTDGVSNVNSQQTVPYAQLAHEDGIHIYSIGVGLTDYRELDGIASPPAEQNSFKVSDFDELQAVDDIIFASACPKRFTMPPPTVSQVPDIEVTESKVPKYSETGTDVVFILDSSVDNRIFDWMKTFVKDFVLQLDVDSGRWKVGALTFDSRARAVFHLN